MKPTWEEYIAAFREETGLPHNGPFAESMRSFDRFFSYLRTELAGIESETQRVEAERDRVLQDKPKSRREDVS